MALGWIIDPGSAQFDLNDLSTTFMVSQSLPMPQPRAQYVSAVDVDGDSLYSQNYGNRQITLTCEVKGSTAGAVETTLGYLHQKIAAINREAVSSRTGVGGALQYTSPTGKAVTFDVCSVSASPDLSATYFLGHLVTMTLTFDCLPAWRGAEVTSLSTHTETTAPAVIFTETGITGDIPARGRLVVTEAQGATQQWVTWGVRSRHYDSAATAGLYYEAESRTPIGSAATATGTSTPSGAGSNVVRSGPLATSMSAVLSTQASGGGSHLSHIGDYRVYARLMDRSGNAGTISYALQWAAGDFLNPTTNDTVTHPSTVATGLWALVDLGLVSIPPVVQGSQIWEGRLLAKSTVAGDTIDVDYLMLVPVTEGSGVVSAPVRPVAPGVIGGSDTFKASNAALSTLSADIGGAWATSGGTGDFTEVVASNWATRSVGTDSSNAGRFAILGTTTYTGQVTQVDATLSGVDARGGVLLRWTDSSNFLRVVIDTGPGSGVPESLKIIKRVSGVDTTLASTTSLGAFAQGSVVTIRVYVDAGGTVSVGLGFGSGDVSPALTALTAQDAVLATGGTLASGKAGFYDESTSSTTARTYRNFLAYAFTGDAALFASRELEVRSDGVIRQDSGGTLWRNAAKYEGDYLFVPPAGVEGRTVQVIVKACRNDPSLGPDSSIDDISAQLIYTPRGLLLPE